VKFCGCKTTNTEITKKKLDLAKEGWNKEKRMIIAILSVSVIVLSIATFCLETLPELKRYHRVTVNESSSAAVETTDDVGLVPSSAREVDDRVRANEPFFSPTTNRHDLETTPKVIC